jgi:pimeloyl-ACP methyl ester carboxylesterase
MSTMIQTAPATPDQFIKIEGINTRYRVTGSGPAMLMLHGIGRSLEDWAENVAAFENSHTVYVVDLAGYGLSDKPDRAYSVDFLRDGVKGFMDVMRIERAVVIGNSLGGAVAMRLALEHPERVTGLVLVASAGFGPKVASLLSLCTIPVLGEWLTRNDTKSSAGTRRVISACFHDQSFVREPYIDHAHQLSLMPGRQAPFLRTLRSAGDWRGANERFLSGIRGRTDDIRVPSLIVWGQQDRIIPSVYAENAARIHDAEVKIYDPCGHFPQIERAAEFNDLVRSFLERNGI